MQLDICKDRIDREKGKKEITIDALEVSSNLDFKKWPLDFVNNEIGHYTTFEENVTQDDLKEMDVSDIVPEVGVRMKQEEVMLMMDQHALTQQELFKAKAPQDRYEKISLIPKCCPECILTCSRKAFFYFQFAKPGS